MLMKPPVGRLGRPAQSEAQRAPWASEMTEAACQQNPYEMAGWSWGPGLRRGSRRPL